MQSDEEEEVVVPGSPTPSVATTLGGEEEEESVGGGGRGGGSGRGMSRSESVPVGRFGMGEKSVEGVEGRNKAVSRLLELGKTRLRWM